MPGNWPVRLYVPSTVMLRTHSGCSDVVGGLGLRWGHAQHNQRFSRKAKSVSGGRYRPGFAPSGAVRAIARSLSAASACS